MDKSRLTFVLITKQCGYQQIKWQHYLVAISLRFLAISRIYLKRESCKLHQLLQNSQQLPPMAKYIKWTIPRYGHREGNSRV